MAFNRLNYFRRKVIMKNLIHQTRRFSSVCSKVVIALTFISTISVLCMSSAYADHGHGRGNGRGHHDNHYDHDDDHDGYGYRQGYQQPFGYKYGSRQPYGYRYGYRQPYSYAQPVYVPPPVYYGPMQSPGVSLFFPLNLSR